MNKSDSIGIPVYVVNTPRGAALYKRIERIHIERMKRNEAKEKLHLKRYSSDPEYKHVIDSMEEKFKYPSKNKSNKLESLLFSTLIVFIFAFPIVITACTYFLFDFFFYH